MPMSMCLTAILVACTDAITSIYFVIFLILLGVESLEVQMNDQEFGFFLAKDAIKFLDSFLFWNKNEGISLGTATLWNKLILGWNTTDSFDHMFT